MSEDDDPVCGYQGIDGHKVRGRHTVNENVIVAIFEPLQNISHNGFLAHCAYQYDSHTGQFDIAGEQIHTLLVPNNAISGEGKTV